MKLTLYGVGISLSVLKISHLLCFQQLPVLNVMSMVKFIGYLCIVKIMQKFLKCHADCVGFLF